MLVYQGDIIKKNLAHVQLSIEELESAVREHGIEKIADVSLAIMEVDGNISVLSDNFKNKSSKRHKAHKALNRTQ